jgi:hypothetical protein
VISITYLYINNNNKKEKESETEDANGVTSESTMKDSYNGNMSTEDNKDLNDNKNTVKGK